MFSRRCLMAIGIYWGMFSVPGTTLEVPLKISEPLEIQESQLRIETSTAKKIQENIEELKKLVEELFNKKAAIPDSLRPESKKGLKFFEVSPLNYTNLLAGSMTSLMAGIFYKFPPAFLRGHLCTFLLSKRIYTLSSIIVSSLVIGGIGALFFLSKGLLKAGLWGISHCSKGLVSLLDYAFLDPENTEKPGAP